MRNGLFTQKAVSVVDQEARRVEHHQDFGEQRSDVGLPRFFCDQGRARRLVLLQLPLEFTEEGDAKVGIQCLPSRLGCAGSRHRSLHGCIGGALQFAQDLAGRGIH